MSADHETPIKTPKQLITVVVLAFIVPIIIIVLLGKFVGASKRTGAGTQAMAAQAVEARIRPVAGFELIDASAPRALKTGEQIYTAQCSACHAAGVAGAPKTGDAAGWQPRIASGLEALVNSALKGKGAMPAQGGGAASDFEILRAVVFMANSSGGSLKEPEAPAAK
jgi:cytochrome c5